VLENLFAICGEDSKFRETLALRCGQDFVRLVKSKVSTYFITVHSDIHAYDFQHFSIRRSYVFFIYLYFIICEFKGHLVHGALSSPSYVGFNILSVSLECFQQRIRNS
jgi:hypothetical protein